MEIDKDGAASHLANIRKSIDNIDAALIFILAERFKQTDAVGLIKAQYRLAPTDLEREEFQKKRLRQMAVDASLNPDFAEGFLAFVIKEVISHHNKIAKADIL